MTNRNYLAVVLLAAGVGVLLMAASSCYTILRHPRLAQADQQQPDNNQCFDCHTESEIFSFHHPVTIGRPPVDWDDALYTPWWYDVYWSEDDTYRSRYRETFRPGGMKSTGGDSKTRGVSPELPVVPSPPVVNPNEEREKKDSQDKEKTPASEKRKLRPKKKKKDG